MVRRIACCIRRVLCGSRLIYESDRGMYYYLGDWKIGAYADLGNRNDKEQTFSDKVTAVNNILAADVKS